MMWYLYPEAVLAMHEQPGKERRDEQRRRTLLRLVSAGHVAERH